MSKQNDLIRESIAEAKQLREVAMKNAKLALTEAFSGRLQSMLSAKLAEDDEELEGEEPVQEDEDPIADPDAGEEVTEDDDLAQGDEVTEDDELGAEPDGDEEVTEEEDPTADPAAGEEEVTEDEDPTAVDDTVSDEEPTTEGEEGEDDKELEEIIRELEDQLGGEEEVTEATSSGIGTGDNKAPAKDKTTEDPGKSTLTVKERLQKNRAMIESLLKQLKEEDEGAEGAGEEDLEEIVNRLREAEAGYEETSPADDHTVAEAEEELAQKDAELEEAYKAIRFLKSKINEINLLNSKLLYSNKLFNNYSLNRDQKVKVIENFDRAGTVREVKLVYATLSESFNAGTKGKKKNSLTEAIASSSKGSQISTRPASGKIVPDESTRRLRDLAFFNTERD